MKKLENPINLKLTDNEIIRALEHCGGLNCLCSDCILFRFDDDDCQCSRDLKLNALNLINRQNREIDLLQELTNLQEAEIERLCIEIDDLIIAKDLLFDEAEALIKKAKIESIKECIEKFREIIPEIDDSYIEAMVEEHVNNIYKGMVGDNE